MKFVLVFACVLCALAYIAQTTALPSSDRRPETAANPDQSNPDRKPEISILLDPNREVAPNADHGADQGDQINIRQKRATCDILSFTNAQHSACAVHCVLRGNRGGYCNNQAVCVCRN